MADPLRARNTLASHFEQLSLDEFRERRATLAQRGGEPSPPQLERAGEATGPLVRQPEAAPLRLTAYLATALTSLTNEQREHLFAVSDVISTVCAQYNMELYEPRKATDPVKHPHVLPEDVYRIDREKVLSSDLVVHLADYASTGAGEELDFALAALIPILLVTMGDSRVSRMVTGIPALKVIVTYTDLSDLRLELERCLIELRPVLVERKLAFADYDKNIVGNKVRLLREMRGLDRGATVSVNPVDRRLVGEASRDLRWMTVERLRQIEESTDRVGNPSLLELRQLAAILGTTVPDLVEPDVFERALLFLEEWLRGTAAARSWMSDKDRVRLIKVVVDRCAEELAVQ